jgi:hypothetical protein
MDTLVRPVSRATANPEVAKVSKTIESINQKRYSMPIMKEAGQSRLQSHQAVNDPADSTLEKFPELHADELIPVVASNNKKALRTLGISEGEPKEQPGLPPVSSIQTFPTNSKTPIANSMGSPSTFSFNINDNLRRIAPGATNSPNSNRHSVGDMNKLLEQNREATMAAKQKPQPPALTIRRSFSAGATSPTKSETVPNTPTYRARRPSGKTTADRLAWIRELEEGSNGKGANSGRAAMYKNLQGGVADKLARFESSNKALTGGSGPGLVRTNSVSSRISTSSAAYGIESGAAGSRLSRASTMDDEFRRKMEEVAEKAKKKVDKDGEQEALIKQVNRDAELALKEEKRRSLQMNSWKFDYAFNDKAGKKTDLAPATVVGGKEKDAEAEVDLGSFTPTKQGATKMPQFKAKDPNAVAGSANPPVDLSMGEKISPPLFRLKDPNAVAASANPPVKLGEDKISAPVFRVKDPNAVAASANPPVQVEDDGEYDPFNPIKYPVASSIPAIKRHSSGRTQEEMMAMGPAEPEATEEVKEAQASEPMTIAASPVMEETKPEVVAEPAVLPPQAEEKKATPPTTPAPVDQTEAAAAPIPAPTEKTTPSAETAPELKPASTQAAETIPEINEIPPTPPKQKEVPAMPTPKYVALRERAEKAAELPVKAAPAPAPVPVSQTFSRLFGAPMTSGRGAVVPVPVTAPKVEAPESAVPESSKTEKVEKEMSMKKEAGVEKEMPVEKAMPAEKDIPTPKQTSLPIVAPTSDKATLPRETPIEKTVPATPVKAPNPSTTPTKSSPVAALAAASHQEDSPSTPKMGGSSVRTTSESNSPTTPTFMAARLPAFAAKE